VIRSLYRGFIRVSIFRFFDTVLIDSTKRFVYREPTLGRLNKLFFAHEGAGWHDGWKDETRAEPKVTIGT